MPNVFRKSRIEILNQALNKLQNNTPITSVGPGSVARAITEAITNELGDMYDIMDFNFRQQFLTTASGNALDMLGTLYGVERKKLSQVITIDKLTNAFYFYLRTSHVSDINIPAGTNVYTDISSYLGQQFSYSTTEDVRIPAGKSRVSASIKPNFIESVFSAGKDTIVFHDFTAPVGVTVYCTNPKPISARIGYEDDEAYRARISKAIRVSSAGTEEAVRFAALSISGVRDVKIRQAPYGFGSFEVIVVPEDLSTATTLTKRVTDSLDSVRPLGVRMYVKSPRVLTVDMDLQLVMPEVSNSLTIANTVQRAQSAARRYIARLSPGEALVYNRFIQSILDSSEFIKDVIITKYAVAGLEVPRRNYQPVVDAMLTPGSINLSVAKA